VIIAISHPLPVAFSSTALFGAGAARRREGGPPSTRTVQPDGALRSPANAAVREYLILAVVTRVLPFRRSTPW